jgi:acetylglutamate/LysW-gamma-L-alpha-aminoadipate kinase
MTTVVKIGGRLTEGPYLDEIGNDLATNHDLSPILIVHGGGDLVTRFGERMGIKQKFVTAPSGVRSRYTDDETLQACLMVLAGLVNTRVVQALERHGVQALGLTGADCELVKAERREKILVVEGNRKMAIDGGYSGKPFAVNSGLIKSLFDLKIVPVVAPLGIDGKRDLVNMDGDSAAAAIASGLKADTLLFLSDVDGLLVEGKVVSKVSAAELDGLVKSTGVGMNRKLLSALRALQGGVSKVVISNGKVQRPISSALSGDRGTVIQ